MISLYKIKNKKIDKEQFDNIGDEILTPVRGTVVEKENARFDIELVISPRSKVDISVGDIIKSPTHRGRQLFRVYKISTGIFETTIYAEHISYLLRDKYYMTDVRVVNEYNYHRAIKKILDNSGADDLFKSEPYNSNTYPNKITSYYIRKSPLSAIMGGDDNSIINRDENVVIIRDNFTIVGTNIKNAANMIKGYAPNAEPASDAAISDINISEYTHTVDIQDIVTVAQPTYTIDSQVFIIPGYDFIRSQMEETLGITSIREYRIDLPEEAVDEEDPWDAEKIKEYVLSKARYRLYQESRPKIEIDIGFVDIMGLEGLDSNINIYSPVRINMDNWGGVDFKGYVREVEYDIMEEVFSRVSIATHPVNDRFTWMKEV